MTKELALGVLAVLLIGMDGIIPSGLGGTGGGGGSGGAVEAKFDCISFGQTASEGGSITISYKTPVQCWASRSTVSGARVNGDGLFGESFVPETTFKWDWDDNSQGTSSITGVSRDLGVTPGLISTHVYAPSTYAESCGGGTNSLHTLTLTVYSVVAGVRESDAATMDVCVEDPATTWPNPVAFCDDSDCSNDSFASVVRPGTPVHGGTTVVDLGVIIQYCESNGSKRIFVEGGLTFSTTTAFNINNTSCLIESYGGSKTIFDFNVSTSRIDLTGCAKMRISGVTFSANETDVPLFTAGNTEGCILLDNWNVATGAGERLSAVIHSGGGGASPNLEEWYFNNFTFDAHCQLSNCGGATALNAFYLQANHSAFINGVISSTGEHNIRWPNYRYANVLAMALSGQVATKHLLAMRQNCGSLAPCTDEASSHTATVAWSTFRGADDGGVAVQLNNDGSGATDEWTQTFDLEFIGNVFAKVVDANSLPRVYIDPDNGPDSDLGRIRLVQNAVDLTWMDSSTESDLHNPRGGTDYYIAGNAASCVGNCVDNRSIVKGAIGGTVVIKNNVCYENGAGSCDLFPNYTEDATNVAKTSDPWDRDGAAPGTDASFNMADVLITHASSLANAGSVTAYPTDVEGEAIPQSADYDIGVDDE